jgi:AAA15 family ATPase/GTPase
MSWGGKMRLKSISIQNFKSLEEESIKHPSELNVFVGKNNSGKSNILKAIDLFFNSSTRTQYQKNWES